MMKQKYDKMVMKNEKWTLPFMPQVHFFNMMEGRECIIPDLHKED